MKKSITFLIWIISIYLGVVLVLSILLLQKDFYSYIFANNVDPQVRFSIHESNWHPTNPSLTIKDFKSESKEGISNIEEIVIEFSLLKFLIAKLSEQKVHHLKMEISSSTLSIRLSSKGMTVANAIKMSDALNALTQTQLTLDDFRKDQS